ncbi:MAG: apolipoprotein N-acyltransferase, partial [Rhizomicrobium sp.]
MTPALEGLGRSIGGLRGWPRAFTAFLAGAFSALAFAPVEFFPALLLGYAALVLLMDGATAGPHSLAAPAVCGWSFAFGQYLVGLHWIAYPF